MGKVLKEREHQLLKSQDSESRVGPRTQASDLLLESWVNLELYTTNYSVHTGIRKIRYTSIIFDAKIPDSEQKR